LAEFLEIFEISRKKKKMPRRSHGYNLHIDAGKNFHIPLFSSKLGSNLTNLKNIMNPQFPMTRMPKSEFSLIDYRDVENKLGLGCEVALGRLRIPEGSLPNREWCIDMAKYLDPLVKKFPKIFFLRI
jgi:hypothetical protein